MTTAPTTFYDRAAAILARGFSTIPLSGKMPLTQNGAKDRSRDPVVIARWAAEFPQANAAIVADDTFMVLESDNETELTRLLSEVGVKVPATRH